MFMRLFYEILYASDRWMPVVLVGFLSVIGAGCRTTAYEEASVQENLELGPHPRLEYVFPEAFKADAPEPGTDEAEQHWSGVIKRAENLLAKEIEVPEKSGQWIFYYSCGDCNTSLRHKDGKHVCQKCGEVYSDKKVRRAYITKRHNQINKACLILAKAWYVTRRSAFAEEVYRIFSRYAELHPQWRRHDRWGRKGLLAVIGGKRYAQSLDDAAGILPMAKAYDLVYQWDGVSEEKREKIEKQFFAATVNSIYRMYLVNNGMSNHMTWFNAAAATVGAVLGREDFIERAVNGRKGMVFQFKNSVTEEGLWYEGTLSYHFYALKAILTLARSVEAVGIDLTSVPQFKQMFEAPLQLAYPNGYLPAFNDGDRGRITGYSSYYKFATEAWPEAADVKAFAETGTVPKMDSSLYESAGLAYLRRGKGEDAVTAILDFGKHGGHHGHPDKLQLCLYACGREFFLDPGRLTYRCPEHKTWTRQTVAHNTVVVNQESQAPKDGRLLFFERHGQADAVAGEAPAAYDGVSLRRLLVLVKNRALIDVFTVSSKKESQFDWLLHGNVQLELRSQLQEQVDMIHDEAGYQHLSDLNMGKRQDKIVADWNPAKEKKGFVRTHLLPSTETTVYTGKGIGYSLNDEAPFLMSRVRGKRTVFLAVHDLSGSAEAVKEVRSVQQGEGDIRVKCRIDKRDFTVRWNAFESGKRFELNTAK